MNLARQLKRHAWLLAVGAWVVPVFIQAAQAAAQDSPQKTNPAALAMDMVDMPAGVFWMGSDDGDAEAFKDEKPRHPVKLTAFRLGRHEVTQGQWTEVMGANPSRFDACGDDCPVENVRLDEIQAFIENLNAMTGRTYRLPTEAEWEYACRAGGNSRYCGGDDADRAGWYLNNSSRTTHPVAQKQANARGLFDMSGNVWEWTCSAYSEQYRGGGESACGTGGDPRVIRGGSWSDGASRLRPAHRNGFPPDNRDGALGFRLAQDL